MKSQGLQFRLGRYQDMFLRRNRGFISVRFPVMQLFVFRVEALLRFVM